MGGKYCVDPNVGCGHRILSCQSCTICKYPYDCDFQRPTAVWRIIPEEQEKEKNDENSYRS